MSWSTAVVRDVYVCCDECSTSADDKNAHTIADAVRIARREGFKMVAGKVLCRSCQAGPSDAHDAVGCCRGCGKQCVGSHCHACLHK